MSERYRPSQAAMEYIQMIGRRVGVDEFVANYALTTRIYETDDSGFSNHMIGVTWQTVGQWGKQEQERFREALSLARELLPEESSVRELNSNVRRS